MALITLFIQKTEITRLLGNKNDSKKPATLQLDATLSEGLECDSDITEHPIEDGSSISDHVILKPKTLRIEGIISETPMGFGAAVKGAVTSAAGFASKKVFGKASAGLLGVGAGLAGKGLSKLISGNKENRIQSAVTELTAIRDSKAEVKIITSLKKYPTEKNSVYLLKSFSVEKGREQAIKISLSFKEVVRVTSKAVKIQKKTDSKLAQNKQSLGEKTKEQIASTSERGKSILRGLTNLVGVTS